MSFEKIAENRIQAAMEEGKFDNLAGKGKPIDLDAYFALPPEMRLSYSVLKNAKIVPEELQLLDEIRELKEEINGCSEEAEKELLEKSLDEIRLKFNLLLEHRKTRRLK